MSTTHRSIDLQILNPILDQWGLPEKGSSGSAAFDLRACIDAPVELSAGERFLFPTGIAIHLNDPSLCAMVLSRSGLGATRGVTVAQGVGLIDSDYTGEIKVMLLNSSNENAVIQPGDRIAQLLVQSVVAVTWNCVEKLSTSQRGSGGFGSTGRN